MMDRSEHDSEICPYSAPPFPEFTDDHVFPKFLGGRRSVRVCRSCNSRFGHTFEAKASIQLKRMQVFISHFGLDLTRSPATWPSGLVVGDTTYDLKSGPNGVQYELARPIFFRNEVGEIIGGRARSQSEAQQIAESLVKKGIAREVRIEEDPGDSLDDTKLNVDLSYNNDLYRFAAKLVCNAAVLMGRKALVVSSDIPAYLHGDSGLGVRIANCDTGAVRRLRPSLSHTVYLEFGSSESHAIFILFGGLQIYVPLPPGKNGAIVGFLDPLTGEESFREVAPLGLAAPPKFWTQAEAQSHLHATATMLAEEAKNRGATRPPNLTVVVEDLGPSLTEWTDGTYRFGR